MKKSFFVLLGLLMAVTSSMGMSLGRYRGFALIGQPLDLSVQALVDEREDPQNLCAEADIFYGDSRLDKSRVRLTVERSAASGQEVVIRIRTTAVIDEPVVSVYVRAGCLQKTERRYVVLADLVSNAASVPVVPQSPGAVARVPSQEIAIGRNNAGGSAPGDAQSASGAMMPRQASGAPSSRAPMARPRVAKGGGQKPVSRLKLEPLDLSSGRDPLLKSSAELLSTPAATEQERSAAAALWRAVSAQPEDILRDLEKLQALQNSVRGLQMETQKGQLSVQDMNLQMQQARAERYANPLVYALGALLLLALATLAYVLLGRRTVHQREGGDSPWWRKNEPAERGGWSNSLRDAAVSATQVRSNALSSGAKNSVKGDLGEGSAGLDLDLNLDAAESGFTQVEQLYELPDSDPTYSPWRHNRQDFSSSMPTVARAVKAEELFDVQQQADFFVSLGQNDQAIEVLKEHIGDNVQTSALVYLDLFDLYHQLNRKEDYEALREDFDKRFNATMPAFEFYKDSGPGLEAYQGALTRIEALWPSSKVLDIIEESIFRSPDTTATAFDLEAYRELLLLYAVAKEIINPHAVAKDEEWHSSDNALDPVSGGAVGRSAKFAVTSIQPLPSVVVGKEQRAVISSFDLDGPPASSDLGLDLDLTDFSDDTSDLTADSKPNATAPSPAAQVPEAPPYLVSGMGNLIDFDAFDYSVDTSKAKPGTKG